MRRIAMQASRGTVGVPVAAALLALVGTSAFVSTWFTPTPDGKTEVSQEAISPAPQVAVKAYDDSGLDVAVDVVSPELTLKTTEPGNFVAVTWPECPLGGETGEPALPVVRKLFIGPRGATVDLTVATGQATAIDLEAAGFADPVIPVQAPIQLTPGALERATFCQDGAAYAVDQLLPTQRAVTTPLGIVRGQQLYLLEVRPLAYNPARGTLVLWPHIDVSIRFRGGHHDEAGLGPMAPLKGVLLNPPPAMRLAGRGSGNYLIIVAEGFAAAIADFAAAKTAEGFNVMTHTVSAGTANTTIKAYIESLWGTPDAPDYILLVGDAVSTVSTSTTIPYWVGGGDTSADTDLPYACMDPNDDWYPDIAIGRFSAGTVDELQAIVDKSLHVGGGLFDDPEYVRRAAFMAGADGDSGAADTHDWVISTYMDPEGFTSYKLYVVLGADTQSLRNAFNTGCVYGVYYGHSWKGPDSIWMDGLNFSYTDVDNLNNVGEYPFLFNFTCEVGAYADPTVTDCFCEHWHRVPNKGAVAAIGASDYIYYLDNPGWPETSNTEKFLFDSIYIDGLREISPVWQAAIARLVAYYGALEPVSRDYSEMFNLLGDPALRIPEPAPFVITPDPLAQNLCSPPADEGYYTIHVDPVGGFSDPVTLTANGGPPGSSVSFSVNSTVPPFTSLMTVSNVTGGSPGDHRIQVIGTAGDELRYKFVDLQLTNDSPGTVTLTSPPNGQTGVSRIPALTWQPASQAADYDLEVATDSGFTNVVYTATTPDTSHKVGVHLDPLTLYYWHVRAANDCGDGDFSTAFHFTTNANVDYFTEEFPESESDLDLYYYTISLVPNESIDFYEVCSATATELPTDPNGGTPIALDDDDSYNLVLQDGKTVQLYGSSYASFWINSNGNLTFTSADDSYDETLSIHFDQPRVSPLFDDLSPDPNNVGPISAKQTDELVAVTFENIPEYDTNNSNTFQVELFFDGEIRITWLGIQVRDAIVGVSEGTGTPGDFVESDLSTVAACLPFCPGDLTGDGQVGLSDLAQLLGHYGTTSGASYDDGDLDGDGDVDLSDLAELLGLYGTVCW
jgi:hypothetical protein